MANIHFSEEGKHAETPLKKANYKSFVLCIGIVMVLGVGLFIS
jgi:hypothetical protein